MIKYLLEKGADVNIQDPEGDSPLFVCETVEIAKMLVEAGADAKHVNENEMTVSPRRVFVILTITVAIHFGLKIMSNRVLCHFIRPLRTPRKKSGMRLHTICVS